MIIKRNIKCVECNKYNDLYISEDEELIGKVIKCKCGNIQKCTKQSKTTIEWEKHD